MSGRRRKADRPSAVVQPSPQVEGIEWGREAQQEKTEWLWPGAIPARSLTMIEGRKATGKTTLAAALTAALTGGPAVPGWTGPRAGRVLWFASEDRWESEVLPRLSAAGAVLGSVGRVLPSERGGPVRRMVLPDDLGELIDKVRAASIDLLVLDPYVSLASRGLDVRVEQQARLYLEPLATLCWEAGCAALLTRHLRKGTTGDTREQGLGSVAVSNVARAVLRCDEHPHERERWVVSVVAVNAGRPADSHGYALLSASNGWPRIDWRGAVELDSETIAEGRGSAADRDEWLDADRVLFAVVGNRWTRTKEVLADAAGAGVGEKTLRRAKARLGVRSRRVSFGADGYWEWGPPLRGWPSDLAEEGGACAPVESIARMDTRPASGSQRSRRNTPNHPNIPTDTHAPPPDPNIDREDNGDGKSCAN